MGLSSYENMTVEKRERDVKIKYHVRQMATISTKAYRGKPRLGVGRKWAR